MTTYIQNHLREFRPLRGGVAIYNRQAAEYGTLGFIARPAADAPNQDERWIVTAYHVLLGTQRRTAADGEELYQPYDSDPARAVARFVVGRADAATDCATCRIVAGIAGAGEILGLGRVGGPIEPARGMYVTKSGVATGVTEGIIEEVRDDRVYIRTLDGFPEDYSLSDTGDSGALWVDRDTHRAVALHTRGNAGGGEFAIALPIELVLTTLGLEVVTEA